MCPCTSLCHTPSPSSCVTMLLAFFVGSNDAIPPKFPAQLLGSRDKNPLDIVAIKHNEGIYSKRAEPKVRVGLRAAARLKVEAWLEPQSGHSEARSLRTGLRLEVERGLRWDRAMSRAAAQGGAGAEAEWGKNIDCFNISSNVSLDQFMNHLESVKTTHSVFKSAQFYLHHPVPLQHESYFSTGEPSEEHADNRHTGPSSRDFFQNCGAAKKDPRSFSIYRQEGEEDEFSPLTAELDYSKFEDLRCNVSLRNEASQKELVKEDQKKVRDYLLSSSQRTDLNRRRKIDLPLKQSTYSTGSLDELWTKFLDRQKEHHHDNLKSSSELSLVERLDRLARVLQNPIRHSLMPTENEKSDIREKTKGGMQKKIRLQDKKVYENNLDFYRNSRQQRAGGRTINHMKRFLKQKYLNPLSDTSSETMPTKDPIVVTDATTSESDMMTQTEMEITSQTEVSSSISTIDTARLIRAFGHERVRLSPRLSQLYCTISQQKSRSEKWDKGRSQIMGLKYPNMTSAERHRKRRDIQVCDQLN
uniref:Uncharacterized protein n=1 Tax=Pelusios castaneus TaxID=367368 RepID=A0A8C8REL1_9SAUR